MPVIQKATGINAPAAAEQVQVVVGVKPHNGLLIICAGCSHEEAHYYKFNYLKIVCIGILCLGFIKSGS